MSDSIEVSAEDRFTLVDMNSPGKLFPHPFLIASFAMVTRQLEADWSLMWDFRSAEDRMYEDIKDAYREARAYSPSSLLVASTDNRDLVEDLAGSNLIEDIGDPPRSKKKILVMRPKLIDTATLDLTLFDSSNFDAMDLIDFTKIVPENEDINLKGVLSSMPEEYGTYAEIESHIDDERQMAAVEDAMQQVRAEHLDRFLRSIVSHSTLVEWMLQLKGDQITVVPYHAHSIHHVEATHRIPLVRPARRSARYYQSFASDIRKLEQFLNAPKVLEREVENLLRSNPLFMQGLNYKEIYPQVVLPRQGSRDLRPDIICEPFDSEWCDIVELKLPSQKILVDRPNRAHLASGLTSAAAQLREYSAYFDDRKIAERIERIYGFRCYKPRLVVIVGRDPVGYSEEEQRRAMTAYPDLEIVTYDKLLRGVRTRPLW